MRGLFGLNTESSDDEDLKKSELNRESSNTEQNKENQKDEEPKIKRKQGKAADTKPSEADGANNEWMNLANINKLTEDKEFDIVEPTTFSTWEKNDDPFNSNVSQNFEKHDNL